MKSLTCLLLSIALFVAETAHETPQQVLSRYNNYKTICKGLGFENMHCKVKTDIIVFQSSLTKTIENIKQNEMLIFDKVSLNEENAYNVTSGIFTAPVDGIYSFSWTILTKGGKYFITDIMLNGRPIAFNYTDGRGRVGYFMSSSHFNIKMKKDDKVLLKADGIHGQYVHGGEWCTFCGLKL